MNFHSLCHHRSVIFDPCVTPGSTLLRDTAYGTRNSDLLGRAHGNPRGDGIKLIRASLADTWGMLDKLTARFDLIVSSPPEAMIPGKGLPAPSRAIHKAPVRKLALNDAPSEPDIDLGLAVWRVTNSLLSPFGEAMLRVTPRTHELVKREATYARVWCRSVPCPETGTVELYLAADHRALPGSEVLERVESDPSMRSGNLRGANCDSPNLRNRSGLEKFDAVRAEAQRRLSSRGDDHNIWLDGGKIRIALTPFQVASGELPAELVTEVERVNGKTMLDLAVLRYTRDLTKTFLRHRGLRLAPGVLDAFEDVCRQTAVASAPFTRPSPTQRIAWLDEQETILCTRPLGPFQTGQRYRVQTRVITGQKLEQRRRPGHREPEDVLVTGQEVLIEIYHGPTPHFFTQFPITAEMEGEKGANYGTSAQRHLLAELPVHFQMPEVQDIAEADPSLYMKYYNRLKALESAA